MISGRSKLSKATKADEEAAGGIAVDELNALHMRFRAFRFLLSTISACALLAGRNGQGHWPCPP
jgi:hypothetical protein